MGLLETVREKIESENLIPRGGHVVVGFSGGPDSTCLFHILLTLRNELGYTMSAVHINHGLRRIESDEDQWYVESLCEEMGIPLISKTYDVARIAKKNGQSLEEAGREVRYETFKEASDRAAAKRGLGLSMVCVALAHNSGDLSETVLMRVIRGTGIGGLAAIGAIREGEGGYRIVRPLIDVPREDIEKYCALEGLEPCIDSTNGQPDYLRNSIRLELLPTLRQQYNPSIDDALARLSRSAAESRDYFDSLVRDIMERECEFTEAGGAEFPLDTLRSMHPAIRHRLVVAIFAGIGLTQDIGAAHIAAADGLIDRGKTGKRTDFPDGYRLAISYEKVVFMAPVDEAVNSPADGYEDRSFAVAIADIGKHTEKTVIFRDSAMPIEAEALDYDGAMKSEGPSLVLDYDALLSTAVILQLRANARGDRICLPGMDGSKKLQDIFVDAKVPREKRRAILVVATEDEVLWIPGLRRTRLYAPHPGTKRVLLLCPESILPPYA
ncbi:MAG: tRNA lysidine(34) synthetase TilS [Clostridiales Family XIII bacterium]|jgi:tRNA(Ile)-lysidine synthase|nr:tRNA lysidine(34) synthetase TilS [Clostridiales Family XIII bacterium]